MAKIVCSKCGAVMGVAVNPKADVFYCPKCFVAEQKRLDEERRKIAAEAKQLTNEELFEAIDDWWGAFTNEGFNDIEDDVLHDKVIARLREVLNEPE
jgi:DNA-directed RNA polymerase subunit M/transcription elongation factor TFIIS